MAFPYFALFLLASTAQAGRERISIDSGWRFHLGDPEGVTGLLYDVLPPLDGPDGKPIIEKNLRPVPPTIKPWILPTGNGLISDPAKRHIRPAGNPIDGVSFVQSSFDDNAWRIVDLPHDWAIEGPFLKSGNYGGMGRLKTWGPAWYRRTLEIPARDKGRLVFLDVDGAMSYSTVWVNGKLAGGWPYGYSSWRLDITPYVVAGGKNQVVIRLDSPPDSSRWYPGAGLYRNVWLTKTNPVHIAHSGTYITTPEVTAASAKVDLKVTLDNESASPVKVEITTKIYAIDANGRRIGGAVETLAHAHTKLDPKSSSTIENTTKLDHPRLWGPLPQQIPNRYIAVTTVRTASGIVDEYETKFGVRTVQFDANRGLLINGQHIKIQGVNEHHDFGALGAAFNVRAAERKLEILREMGANAIRMSHNPPAPELLELTDRMGFLVVDEVFDCWERKKTAFDFHMIFTDWYEQDLRSMLRRDRNNPSVVLWSVGNEVSEQYWGEDGAAIGRKLVKIVREEDPTRLTMTAMNYAKPDMALPSIVDVISLNYQGIGIRAIPGNFGAFHAKFPNKAILSSESAAALSSRGEYLFPVLPGISGPVRTGEGGDPVRQQVSGYELYAADFGTSADRSFAAHERNPNVAGEFVWTGWDYLGEPTPYYGARSSYFGSIDLAGFKKDRFYLYQANWRQDLPMVHILPHWNWPERVGQVTPVHVFTSGDEAELFVNGKSQGRKKKGQFEYRMRWDDVIYQPGELVVVAYENGKEWAKSSVKTAGEATKLEAIPDRTKIANDGKDLSFVTVRITDQTGITSPRASNRIRFTVEGPGEIVATDNGDPTNFEAFPSPTRNAFNGLCLVIVRAKPGQVGAIKVHAESDSIQPAVVTIQTVRGR